MNSCWPRTNLAIFKFLQDSQVGVYFTLLSLKPMWGVQSNFWKDAHEISKDNHISLDYSWSALSHWTKPIKDNLNPSLQGNRSKNVSFSYAQLINMGLLTSLDVIPRLLVMACKEHFTLSNANPAFPIVSATVMVFFFLSLFLFNS